MEIFQLEEEPLKLILIQVHTQVKVSIGILCFQITVFFIYQSYPPNKKTKQTHVNPSLWGSASRHQERTPPALLPRPLRPPIALLFVLATMVEHIAKTKVLAPYDP